MSDLDAVMAGWERRRNAQAEVNEHNKAAVFDALAAAGITAVHVDFDGEGDSGQINDIIAFIGDARAELPRTDVPIKVLAWGATEPSSGDAVLHDAIEALCYAYLGEYHGGWENNDGAYGAFVFDVGSRTIGFEFNGRFTDVDTSTYTL